MPLKPLDEIFEEMEELGLAADAKPEASGGTEDRRLRHTLAEVNAFIDQHGRLPGEKGADGVSPSLSEWDLASKLKGLREKAHCDIEIHDLIVPADRHGILETAAEAPAPPESLDEIFDSGHPLLSGPAEDIFVLRHVPPKPARSDAISERSVCRDFEEFRPLFDECIAELSDGTRRVRRFTNEQEINAGDFFILGGTLLYVAEVGEGHRRGGKRNARLRLIFDNGTEGRNLLRSLAAELYKDLNGRRVTDPNAGPLFDDGERGDKGHHRREGHLESRADQGVGPP